MRATNQQDLIYKRGQAGITKASVTIVFDNSDRSKSPVGYEDYKQITVTRQVCFFFSSASLGLTTTRQIALPNVSKYLLNGHKALQANIQTLFQSVQLNINNPNFVIMQGRITKVNFDFAVMANSITHTLFKVLNMRPPEILGMVEEAAGTRMFEERKEKAKKTMSKKEKRMQEIKSLLDEEITPKLNKLREQKRSFIQYQKSVTELEKLGRTLRAYEWHDAQGKVAKRQAEIEAKGKEVAEKENQKRVATKECEKREKEVIAVQKSRDAELRKGGKLKKLQDEAGELGKGAAKLRAQAEIMTASIGEEEKRVDTLEAKLKEVCCR
jgi:structural maintenance of chromosome 2